MATAYKEKLMHCRRIHFCDLKIFYTRMPARISHIAFSVSNLQRSAVFYREIIGLQPLEEPFKIGMHSWFSLSPVCQLHLIAGAKEVPPFHINHHLALRTNAFEEFINRLLKAGIPYSGPFGKSAEIYTRPDGVRQVFFQDPDGYWLEMNDEKEANENV